MYAWVPSKAFVARLLRIFFRLLFLLCMFCQIGCRCGAFAPYFFYFSLAAPCSGKAPQAGAKEIWCKCGAFAPYFFQIRFLLLDAHWGGSCTFLILIIPAQALGRYMSFNLLIGIAEHPARADNGF